MNNYYEILEIEKNASDLEIRKSYRRLALMYHPDKKTANKDKFIQISEAYQVLSDIDKKKIYDENLSVSFSSPNFKDSLELFNQVFDSMDPIIGDYLKSTFTQFKESIFDENISPGDILNTFTNENFIDKTTDTLNKYIKKRTLANITNFYIHTIDISALKTDDAYIIDIDIDFLRKYTSIKLIVNQDAETKNFMLDLNYTDFTIKVDQLEYDIVIYNNFPENLYRRSNNYDLELFLPIHIDNYLEGFHYYNKLSDKYVIDCNIKLDKSNIVKLKNEGLFNYNTKNLGDLYIILIPDKISNKYPNITIGDIKQSYDI